VTVALTLNIEFLGDCYEATLGGVEREWPPHPARVFCALVSVAEASSTDDDALRWLEGQAPPQVLCPAPVGQSERAGFVPTNVTTTKGGHQVHVARTSGARSWPRTVPAGRVARIHWPSAEPTTETASVLGALARRVGYLGRSTSQVLLSFTTDVRDEDWDSAYEPTVDGSSRLRVPYAGYLDRLRFAHDGGDAPWSVSRSVAYRKAADAVRPRKEQTAAPSPYRDVLVFAFDPGDGIDGWHAPAITRAFKAAVLQRLGQPQPGIDPWMGFDERQLALLHGHHDGSRRQCAFLSLPFVGNRRATGEVLGLAIALSPDLEPAVRLALLQLAGLDRDDDLGPRLNELRVPGLGRRCRLRAPDGRETLSVRRWSRVDHRWTTVFPIVLDWFPKRRLPTDEVVARGCVAAGYPRPASVEILPAPRLPGSPHIPRRALVRRQGEVARPAVHATVQFDQRVTGPVVVGHLRHLGLGLCLPLERRGD
jgi:CRISPR-associated protein Csb2